MRTRLDMDYWAVCQQTYRQYARYANFQNWGRLSTGYPPDSNFFQAFETCSVTRKTDIKV